ncbi:MAG: M16 family metallopeptidase [Saprospiraceae bacterium]
MIKRPGQPPLRTIQNVVLPNYSHKTYENGLQLIVVDGGVQDVFKLEVIFNVGRHQEHKPLVSRLTLRMLREGTAKYDSDAIEEMIDFHGSTLETPHNMDASGVVLYGLNQHFTTLLPLLVSMVTEPTFPEHELKEYVSDQKQDLIVELSKNDVVAFRQVTESIFGNTHPYGYNSTPEKYNAVNTDDLKKHFNSFFTANNCTVVLSGKINNKMISELENKLFSNLPNKKNKLKLINPLPKKNKYSFIENKDSVQTAIRLGMNLFGRNHEDFNGLYFLNTVMGDYFSSRLMLNIREDKGYTYHIHSAMDSLKHGGSWIVATETAHEYVEKTLEEINKELKRIKSELIPEDEIKMVRNYSLGSLLTALDGPFNSSEVIKGIILNDLEKDSFQDLIHTIKNISQKELIELANKYFIEENIYTQLVGVRN